MCDLLVLAPAVHGGGVRDSEWQLNKLVTEDQPRQPRGQEGLVGGLPATSTLQIKILTCSSNLVMARPNTGELEKVTSMSVSSGLSSSLGIRRGTCRVALVTAGLLLGVTAATWNLGWSSVILILTLCSFWTSMVSHSLSTSPPYMLGCGVRTRCTNQLTGIYHSNIFKLQ